MGPDPTSINEWEILNNKIKQAFFSHIQLFSECPILLFPVFQEQVKMSQNKNTPGSTHNIWWAKKSSLAILCYFWYLRDCMLNADSKEIILSNDVRLRIISHYTVCGYCCSPAV